MDKSKLVFLDTETTGRGQNDRLCQVAYKFGEEKTEALFLPPIPIQVEAMAITHITNKMVADKESFIGSETQKKLSEIFEAGNILVAHNAQFDAEMLRRENVEVGKMIDTLKIAQHLDPEGKIPRYGLQYLRYFLDIEIDGIVPHSAMGDVLVLERLFERLFEKMFSELQEESAVVEEMLRVSELPILIRRFNFGKYSGMKLEEVAQNDPGYLNWLLDQKIKEKERGEMADENLIYTLEKHLGKNR